MKITHGTPGQLKRARTVACFIVQDAKVPAVGGLYDRGRALAGAVARAQQEGFSGKDGQVWIAPAGGKGLPERVFLVGCGSRSRSSFDRVRRAGGHLGRKLREFADGPVDVITPDAASGPDDAARALRAVVEGMRLGTYQFLRHKSRPAAPRGVDTVRVVSAGDLSARQVSDSIRRAESVAAAVNFARDLVNEPPGSLTPAALGRAARSIRGRGITARVLGKADIRRQKMGALLGVNQGSVQPPVFIHMVYKPKKKGRRKIALVGKGITFDSGGLCLKTADGMLTMKDDMGGAAVVLGVFHALAALQPDVEVHGIVPSTENMTGGDAYKPGDVLKAMNGKTIEITNTDAEGRLVLADALTYASRLEPAEIVDFATLTGAVVVALGNSISGLWSTSQEQADRILRASIAAGEHLWQMPLFEPYRDALKSHVADMVNSERRDAGSIKAALFLSEFVDCPAWTHIDIAGTAWTDKEQPYAPTGGTGAGVRTMLEYVMGF